MAFKKNIDGNSNIKIISVDQSTMFPVGFSYISGNELYEVIKAYADSNVQWRRIKDGKGNESDVMVNTIFSDLREEGASIVKNNLKKE